MHAFREWYNVNTATLQPNNQNTSVLSVHCWYAAANVYTHIYMQYMQLWHDKNGRIATQYAACTVSEIYIYIKILLPSKFVSLKSINSNLTSGDTSIYIIIIVESCKNTIYKEQLMKVVALNQWLQNICTTVNKSAWIKWIIKIVWYDISDIWHM